MNQPSINPKDDSYLEYIKNELALSGIEIPEKILKPLTALTTIFYDAGHSGFSAGFGTASTNWALCSVYKYIEDNKPETVDWVNIFDIVSNGKVKDFETMEEGPDKWVRKDVIASMRAMNGTDLSKEEFDTLVKYFNNGTRFKPLSPLTGDKTEWVEHDHGVRQNNRLSNVFGIDQQEDGSSKQGYDLDGVVFSDNRGITWFTTGISRRIFDFPYEGETIYCILKDRGAEEDTVDLIGTPEECEVNLVTDIEVGNKLLHFKYGTVEVTDVTDNMFTIVRSGGILETFDRHVLSEVNDFIYDVDLQDTDKTVHLKIATFAVAPTKEWYDEWQAKMDAEAEKQLARRQELKEQGIRERAEKDSISFEEAEKLIEEEAQLLLTSALDKAADAVGVDLNSKPEEPTST